MHAHSRGGRGGQSGRVLDRLDQEAVPIVKGRELVKRSSGESLGRVTVSVGVAAYRLGDTAVSLLERADHCMFAAKRGGRNRVVDDTAAALIDVA